MRVDCRGGSLTRRAGFSGTIYEWSGVRELPDLLSLKASRKIVLPEGNLCVVSACSKRKFGRAHITSAARVHLCFPGFLQLVRKFANSQLEPGKLTLI